MTIANFWERLYGCMELPFEYEDVDEIIFLGGVAFVKLKDGTLYNFHATIIKESKEEVSDG
jgi:hypothetical protein